MIGISEVDETLVYPTRGFGPFSVKFALDGLGWICRMDWIGLFFVWI